MQINQDKLHEECGVFGILDTTGKNVSNTIYYGLCALQHRGQESAGIAVCNTEGPLGNLMCYKDMGLVNEIFTSNILNDLSGNIGIGHVRYSTTGESSVKNAQPIAINYFKGTLALVHNGNLTNMDDLKNTLQENGAIFHTTTDSEIITYQIALERTKSPSIEAAVCETAKKLKGGFALIVMSPQKLIGVRDTYGLKPLCLGKREGSYILASESCALSAVGAEFVRDIFPGEIITITKDSVVSDYSLCTKSHAHCIFEYIYFARLDSTMDGISIHDARVRAGAALAKDYPVEADLVVGVPDSGLAAAIGYSEHSGIPYGMAFQKNSYVGRTFIKPTQSERESAVQIKLNVIPSVVKGKRIVLIDDSIVRGTTISKLIRILKKAGATEVHVRISSPPFLYPCHYGTDVPTTNLLIASKHSNEEIREQIGADSLGYLKLSDFTEMVGDLPLCTACFTNEYPII
ncbi:MAG: amidophosphoribosyltransferase [Lachnospiraceae bacterium]|nr:amidophosphoribosyltransferase [Lachnospiraceae bacterium]